MKVWDVDALGDAMPFPLMLEWGAYIHICEEDRKARELESKAKAESDATVTNMRSDPKFRRGHVRRGG